MLFAFGKACRQDSIGPSRSCLRPAILGSVLISERIGALQNVLAEHRLAAYIVPTQDPHASEIPPTHWELRAWLTGFRGSAGTAVVTSDRAGLWTDSRYHLEAEESLEGTPVELFKSGEPDVPEHDAWLAATLSPGQRVGVCGAVISVEEFRRIAQRLGDAELELVATDDLVGSLWEDRPPLPREPVFLVPTATAGKSRAEKIAAVRGTLRDAEHHACVIATLDDIAWLFNIRGRDVAYNPVTVAYALIGAEEAQLFIDSAKISSSVEEELSADGVRIRSYDAVTKALSELSTGVPDGEGGLRSAVLRYSPRKLNMALFQAIPENVVVKEAEDPTTIPKAQKNGQECEGIRTAMRKDGRALVRFLIWLEQTVQETPPDRSGPGEVEASERLAQFRAEDDGFVMPSFGTISAYGAHGAVVHYSPTPESDVPIGTDSLYLVDSGGHYRHGTTDITRTVCLGTPTDEQIEDFSLVLAGHIDLARTSFPRGTTGTHIDAIARRPLWQCLRNYGHGTGHGVGFFLNVHEGPQRISPRPSDVALEPGMVCSNEPGLYRAGRYGIRIENLVLVQEEAIGEFGEFRSLATLSLCPIDLSLVRPDILGAERCAWLDAYHSRLYEELAPLLDAAEREWLAARTVPVSDSLDKLEEGR